MVSMPLTSKRSAPAAANVSWPPSIEPDVVVVTVGARRDDGLLDLVGLVDVDDGVRCG